MVQLVRDRLRLQAGEFEFELAAHLPQRDAFGDGIDRQVETSSIDVIDLNFQICDPNGERFHSNLPSSPNYEVLRLMLARGCRYVVTIR